MPADQNVKDDKVLAVINWLNSEREGVQTSIRQHNNLVIVAQLNEGERLQLFVWTAKDLVKWFDRAARRLLKSAMPMSTAMGLEWPQEDPESPENALEDSAN